MPTAVREFVNSMDPPVRGYLHLPEAPSGNALVLTHGAGSNANASLLVALAEAFCADGFTVLRCDLPFRQTRAFGMPGRGDAARDREGLKNAVAALKKQVAGSIYLGGHSYGGRQASMLCSEQPDLVAGLLLLSYPLHPPRKPQELRTQHLPYLRTPTLFVHGTRDPFASIAELEDAIKLIPGRAKLLKVEGAGHDLGFKGKAKQEGMAEQILSEFARFTS